MAAVDLNAFRLPAPCVWSFSGGRTSGYMMDLALEAHGGRLPPGHVVVFCNTGRERHETLDFVERCSQRLGVPVVWLEYRFLPGEGKARGGSARGGEHNVVVVDYATASRDGEPFAQVIQARQFLPNPVMRFCTAELKIRTTNRYVRRVLGWDHYHNAIGLRADEEQRVLKMRRKRTVKSEATLFGEERTVIRGADHPPGETPQCPLFDAGVRLEDVMEFWKRQRGGVELAEWLALPHGRRPGWDLGLEQDEGNCDLCFLKGSAKLVRILERRPDLADWWVRQEQAVVGRERPGTARFRDDRPPYAELLEIARGRKQPPGWLWADKGGPACGGVDECRCTD